MSSRCSVLIVALSVICVAPLASAQVGAPITLPSAGVTCVVPLGPASASDIVARAVSPALAAMWKVPVTVDNRPGANGIVGTQSVVRAPGDGSALLWIASNHIINETLYAKLPYNGLKDLRPIAQVGVAPLVLVVPASSPVNNLRELIKFGKEHPGKMSFGSAGSGSTTHLAGEIFKDAAGIDIVHVPYKAIGQAATDLMGGRLDLIFLSPPTAMGHIKTGKMKAIGAASRQRLATAPDIPTLAESGLPGFEVEAILGVLAPASMSDTLAEKIAADIVHAVSSAEVQKQILQSGLVPHPLGLKDFTAVVRKEHEMWSRVVKSSGAKVE